MYVNYLLARCSRCGEETPVTETVWPATRVDPADGESHPEECGSCAEEFGEDTQWRSDEPPDPY